MSTKIYGAYLVNDESQLEDSIAKIIEKLHKEKVNGIIKLFYDLKHLGFDDVLKSYLDFFDNTIYCKLLDILGKKILYFGEYVLSGSELKDFNFDDYSYTNQTDDFFGSDLKKFWEDALRDTCFLGDFTIKDYSYTIDVNKDFIINNTTLEIVKESLKRKYAQVVINNMPELWDDSISENASLTIELYRGRLENIDVIDKYNDIIASDMKKDILKIEEWLGINI